MERRLVLTMGMAVCLAFSAGCGGYHRTLEG